ncbi:MAG: AMP-binding protein [Gemmatimonadetes bacterium]|nr:AMP-binding protein [Gemmatimonadota bacterium]
MTDASRFVAARDLLLANPTDYDRVLREFRWPRLERFNWALDHFDRLADHNGAPALIFASPAGVTASHSFAELKERSDQLANLLRARGAARGDRLLMMLPNRTALWETMLAAMKLGIVLIPATPQLTRADLEDRFGRGRARHVITDAEGAEKIGALGADGVRLVVGDSRPGWLDYRELEGASPILSDPGVTRSSDPLFLYFTSGTTARPKLVLHTHQSYPVGHLSTLYWLGLRPGDRHLNISSPGWAKHAYSSFFPPWTAGAAVVVFDAPRADPTAVIETIERADVTTFCGPPTLWRMMINEELGGRRIGLREALSAGEPLNPEVIDRIRQAWGITIREGYGQTETTLLVGNFPGQPVKPGSMGKPAPGFSVELRPRRDEEAAADRAEGEIAVSLADEPMGLMEGYLDDPERMAEARREGFYRTGDVALADADGYITYVGRADDVFKSSGYRLSPFELESVLIEHPAVAEAAVVESPDPIRMVVPKAFLALRAGHEPTRDTALAVFRFVRERLPAFQRIRRVEFAALPKTISGKIRRVELRLREREQVQRGLREPTCHWVEDFPELKG